MASKLLAAGERNAPTLGYARNAGNTGARYNLLRAAPFEQRFIAFPRTLTDDEWSDVVAGLPDRDLVGYSDPDENPVAPLRAAIDVPEQPRDGS